MNITFEGKTVVVTGAAHGFGRAIAGMRRRGVACERPVYKPLHRYLRQNGFPGADEMHRRAMSVPLYPGLPAQDIPRIAGALRAVAGAL